MCNSLFEHIRLDRPHGIFLIEKWDEEYFLREGCPKGGSTVDCDSVMVVICNGFRKKNNLPETTDC